MITLKVEVQARDILNSELNNENIKLKQTPQYQPPRDSQEPDPSYSQLKSKMQEIEEASLRLRQQNEALQHQKEVAEAQAAEFRNDMAYLTGETERLLNELQQQQQARIKAE